MLGVKLYLTMEMEIHDGMMTYNNHYISITNIYFIQIGIEKACEARIIFLYFFRSDCVRTEKPTAGVTINLTEGIP